MSMLMESHLDELTEQFEGNWSTTNFGCAYIRNFISSQKVQPEDNVELLSSLIQVDMERRWLSWSFFVSRQAKNLSVEDIMTRRNELPTLEQYRDLFTDPAAFEGKLPELAALECHARSHWGDAIGPLFYKDRYNLFVPSTEPPTVRVVTCVYDVAIGQSKQTWPLRGRSTFGRRRSSDPQWNVALADPEGNRFLIADKGDASISRTQLEIDLLNNTHLTATNTSQVANVTVGGKTVLEPGCCKLLAYPFSIRLPGRTLIFD